MLKIKDELKFENLPLGAIFTYAIDGDVNCGIKVRVLEKFDGLFDVTSNIVFEYMENYKILHVIE